MHETVSEMLRSGPKGSFVRVDALAKCIDACFECHQACVACADACLGEKEVAMLARCIRLTVDCADVCETTGRLLSRQYEPDFDVLRQALALVELAAGSCADECEQHAGEHEHCRICGESCRRCEEACQELFAALEVDEEADQAAT